MTEPTKRSTTACCPLGHRWPATEHFENGVHVVDPPECTICGLPYDTLID